MQGNVIVQRGVYCSRSQTVGNTYEAQLIELCRHGKAEHGGGRKQYADGGYFMRSELRDHAVGHKAGGYGRHGNYHSDNTEI